MDETEIVAFLQKTDTYFSSVQSLKNKILKDSKVKEEFKIDEVPSEPPRKKKRGPPLTESVKMSICDMGNGCWTFHHFTSKIQTRQY